MTFKEGFTTYFISIIIGIPISVLFSIILFNYIDIEAQDIIKETTIKNTVEAMEKWDVPSSQINKTIVEMEKSNPFSTVELLKSTIVYIAVYCFIGLILAFFDFSFFQFKTNTNGNLAKKEKVAVGMKTTFHLIKDIGLCILEKVQKRATRMMSINSFKNRLDNYSSINLGES